MTFVVCHAGTRSTRWSDTGTAEPEPRGRAVLWTGFFFVPVVVVYLEMSQDRRVWSAAGSDPPAAPHCVAMGTGRGVGVEWVCVMRGCRKKREPLIIVLEAASGKKLLHRHDTMMTPQLRLSRDCHRHVTAAPFQLLKEMFDIFVLKRHLPEILGELKG